MTWGSDGFSTGVSLGPEGVSLGPKGGSTGGFGGSSGAVSIGGGGVGEAVAVVSLLLTSPVDDEEREEMLESGVTEGGGRV